MRINYDFTDLEAFLAVAESGSFHIAAQQLNVSQSAITRRVQKLESNLGVVLFERSTRSVRQTLAGKRFQVRAQSMLDDAIETTHALRDETKQFAYQRNAIVTVALVPSIIPAILPQAIDKFRQAGYLARISIIDRLANDVSEIVSQGGADFGICSIPTMEANLSFEPLINDRFVVMLNKGHPFAGLRKISWQQLQGSDLIVPAKGTGNRMLIDEAIAQLRLSLIWRYETRRTSTALELAKNDIGAAVLPETAIYDLSTSQMVAVPLIEPTVKRSIGVLFRSHAILPNSASAFLKIVKEVMN